MPMLRLSVLMMAGALLASSGVAQLATSDGTGARLRTLDKLTGAVEDVDIASGAARNVGRIAISLNECRYPEGNAAGEAYASLEITEVDVAQPVFRGWMIASSPALNPMDHPRYDVWVLRCTTP